MIFMKLIVTHYVRNFHFSTSLKYKDVKVKAGVTLQLIGKHLVEITERRQDIKNTHWQENLSFFVVSIVFIPENRNSN